MLNDIIEARPLDHYRVFVRFDDGCAGEVDLAPLLAPFDGVFAPLRNKSYFDQVRVNPDIGTIVCRTAQIFVPMFCAISLRVRRCPILKLHLNPRNNQWV